MHIDSVNIGTEDQEAYSLSRDNRLIIYSKKSGSFFLQSVQMTRLARLYFDPSFSDEICFRQVHDVINTRSEKVVTSISSDCVRSLSTSVDEIREVQDIRVFPNLSFDRITLQFNSAE